MKKKSVSFPEEVEEKDATNLDATNVVLLKTLVAPQSLTRAKSPGTPYYSAENCSKCRFDRLETLSYWLSQIKLAESVGKHFVSAAFFGLTVESKAEFHHKPNGAAAAAAPPPQSQIQLILSRSHDSVPRVSPSLLIIIFDLKSSTPTRSTKPRLADFTPNSEIPNLFSLFSKIIYSGFRF
ncbi:hypothetical protein CMV_011945 [Castanea mollissima]|uniref:Uncharacterized protein n=1 Tax=Castanea mollissima TaxID=60419 RepID=A0A8J4VWJ1_9ROSI|nr:hypothetical protein CMV_011945 [Castanea mollissima]